ncbi:MAG TPA: S8 family serine peptidase [Verrucomicrobiae bacterium]|nr:S8 family serine peptidase [Verrucomicrobiae bacterium]
MISRSRFDFQRRQVALCAGVAVFCGAFVSVFAAPPSGINTNALQEIAALEQMKAAFTPAQRKLDSHFVFQLKLNRRELVPLLATNLRPHVKFESDSRVAVDIDANVTDDLLNQIRQAGGEVVASVPRFHSVRALVPLDALESLASLPEVNSIKRPMQATVWRTVESQGDITHGANFARTNFGVTGAGIKIGVLSDSVDYLSNLQATGDLPTNVVVLPGQSGVPGIGEGTAMLEIVNQLAPGAQLYFATASTSEAQFAQNILSLRSNGCNIIVDDESYDDESPFQDGIVAQAVNTVTTNGALYFSAAGNSGNRDDGTSSVWEGDFLSGGSVGAPITTDDPTGNVHNFGTASHQTNYDIAVGIYNPTTIVLFWSDPLGASTNDYDLFVLNSAGTSIFDYSNDSQTGTQNPIEACTADAGDRIVIVQYNGTGRFLHLEAITDGVGHLGFGTPGNIRGHAAATNAIAVGAVDSALAYPNLFTAADTSENYSSDGPRRVFYNADGSAITPGNFSSTGGAVRLKPDLCAADDVSNSVPGFQPYVGTSASAPHAAAIAALVWSANPAMTAAQVRTVLTNTALDIDAPGWDRDSGAGIVMANLALQCLPVIQSIKPTNGAVNVTWRTLSNHVYQVQYETNLALPGWANLGSSITATNIATTAPESVSDPQRFYRVELVH